jgi:lactate dehydrogenase-like 2-hydroxyacid dehydrogenase
MAEQKTDILLIGPPKPTIVNGLAAFTVHRLGDTKDHDALLEDIGPRVRAVASSVTSEKIGGDLMAKLPRLEIVSTFGVGYDHIDIKWAAEHGVTVTNTPQVLTEEVADTALGLLLCTVREFPQGERYLRAGKWVERAYPLTKATLRDRTVGIVGMGAIGQRVAKKWLGAFDAKLFAFDPHAPADAWAGLPHHRVARLHEMLPQVDLVSLHLPLTAESRHLIGRDELALMRKDAVLVNTSRGGIVDEAALYESMSRGHLFGAGLDVFEVEPPPADHPLLSLPNVVATPHASGGTHDTQVRSATQVAQQVIHVLQGGAPQNRVV